MDSKATAGDYHVLELIGEGSFGKVYRGRRICTGEVRILFYKQPGDPFCSISRPKAESALLRYF